MGENKMAQKGVKGAGGKKQAGRSKEIEVITRMECQKELDYCYGY